MNRVLQVVGNMNRGGAEAFLMNVLRNCKQDVKFYFLCFDQQKYDYEDEVVALGGEIIRIDFSKGFFSRINQICKVLQQYQISTIHSHIQLASMYAVIAGRIARTPKIITHAHSASPGRKLNLIYRIYEFIAKKIIAGFSSDLLACGREAGQYLFDRHKFAVVNNGIDLVKFKFDFKKRQQFRRQYGISEKDFVIGMVGRMEPVKNHQFALELFKKYFAEHQHLKLALAGQGSLSEALRKQVTSDTQLSDKIVFLGLVEDTESMYSAFDVLIMPSLYEGLPVALIEAQANGLLCLCSQTIDPLSDISGLLTFLPIDESSYRLWSDQIDSVIALGRANNRTTPQKVYQSGYDVKDLVTKLMEVYNRQND